MPNNTDSFDIFNLNNMQKTDPQKTDKNSAQIILGIVACFLLFFFLPAVIITALLLKFLYPHSKVKWEYGSLLVSLLFLVFIVYQNSYQIFLQFGSLWRKILPWVVDWAEYFTQQGQPFEITPISWLALFIFTWFLSSLTFVVYRRLTKNWLTHEKEADKVTYYESDEFKEYFANRTPLLEDRQAKYRQSSLDQLQAPFYVGANMHKEDVFLPLEAFFTHTLIQGTTGSGKTTLMYAFIEGACKLGISSLFLDGKGDPLTIMEIQKIAMRYGRNVLVFSEYSKLHFNPVRHGKPTSIKDRLIAMMDWSEQFYANESQNNLQKIISFIQDYIEVEKTRGGDRPEEQGDPLKMDLETIHRFLDYEEIATYLFYEQSQEIIDQAEKISSNSSGAEMAETIREYKSKTAVESTLHQKYMRQFFDQDELTYGDLEEIAEMKGEQVKLIKGLRTQIELLIYSDLGEKFLESDDPNENIDILQAIERGDIILFSFNANDYESFIKGLGRLVISNIAHVVTQLYHSRLEEGREFLGVLGLFDEIGAYISERIITIVARARSARFGAVLGAQSKSDLVTKEGDLSQQIMDNINLFFLGRSNDPDNAEYSSRVMGTYSDIDRTVMTENKLGTLSRLETKEERGTIRNVRKFWFDPDEIKDLPKYTFTMIDKTKDELQPTREKIFIRNVMKGL